MQNENISMMPYDSPMVCVIPVSIGNALCESPVPGGNEDVGYDEW